MSSLIERVRIHLKEVPALSAWAAQWNDVEGFQIHVAGEEHLPLISADLDCCVILEGFLQNRSDLFSKLGINSESNNDADLIRFAFSKWGQDVFAKLRGVFCLAIWEKRKNTLLFVRDHCGIYPAFYCNKDSRIIFSTSVADIIQHPAIGRALNRSAFVDFLCHRRPMPEETFYAEVKRVLPGHAISFSNGSQHLIRYWYSTPPEGIREYVRDTTGFGQVLEKSVRRCTDIGNSGIFLSGGLDSVSIACVATDLAKRDGFTAPSVFSIGFPHPDFNEIEKQKSVAHQLGLNLCLRSVDELVAGRGLIQIALDLGKSWSQPMWSTWQPLYMALGQEARQKGYSVMLTGAGGDEWLNVGSNLMADLIRLMDFRGLNRTIKIFLRSYRIPRGALLKHLFWKAGFRLILAEYARRIARQITPQKLRAKIRERMRTSTLPWVASDPDLKAAADERVEVLVEEYMNRILPKDKYPFYSFSSADHFVNSITSMEMEQSYESSRRIGLNLLHPYFDPDVIHELVRISPDVLQQGGMEKGIIRGAIAKRFPNLKFETQKKASAMNYWLSLITTEGRDIYFKNGGCKSLIEMGIVNGKKIDEVMNHAFASTRPFDNAKIWDLLCLETWSRSHQ